jgi:cupin 2 domain-containing protein
MTNNIFTNIPAHLKEEAFTMLLDSKSVKIERIVSKGHTSPKSGWYDQDNNEWVMVLQGEAKILIENQGEQCLVAGSYLNIPAHQRHKVTWTKEDTETIWLAVHY